jgi:2-keto-3-deoxy-L-rhamnonate aldolase RhmA
MKLFLINNQADVAEYAFSCGVDRVMVDTETLGKNERQQSVDAVFNSHEIKDVAAIKRRTSGEVICRINRLNAKSSLEIDRAIESGADFLMVPMIEDELDVRAIVKLIDGRIKFIPLLETASSIIRLKNIVEIEGIDEIYFGLNDLSIQMQLKFLHEITASGLMRFCSDIINGRFPFGFGGIARIGDGMVPAEYILSEHYFCKSSRIILGRAFHKNAASLEELKKNTDFSAEVSNLKEYWDTMNASLAAENNKKLYESMNRFRADCVLRTFKTAH